tara:strand:- start:39 stop:1172 length:1134 start_codon:yes stop_codon:yes gene_type:complete
VGTPAGNQALIYDVTAGAFKSQVSYTNRFEDEVETGINVIGNGIERAYSVKAEGDGIYLDASPDTPTAGKVIKRKIYHKTGFISDSDAIGDYTLIHTFADDTTYANTVATFDGFEDGATYGVPPFTLAQSWEEADEANLLLDTYTGASAAYSLRKLRTLYTGDAVEVYNGSSYADIGFSNDELDTTALAAHCGSSDGFVSKWYDQSGNTNTAAQTVTGSMPKIYDGSTGVVTRGGKPSVLFTGSTQILPISTSFNNNTYLYVGEPLARSQGFGANSKSVRTDGTAGYRNFGFEWASGNLYVLHNGTVHDATSGGNISVTLGFDVVLFRRGSVGTQTPDSIGKENTQYISEIISYSTLESDSNLVGISNNANAFYSAF